jgi:hypothetical protein
MTRRNDGTWEISSREIKLILFLLPIGQAIFTAGAAWAGVTYGLEKKLDRSEFVSYAQSVALQIQSLRVSDSLFIAMQRDQTDRIREIVCPAIKGCR